MIPLATLFPWALILFPLTAGVLIWVYRSRGGGDKLVFGSLLLLKEIQQQQVLRKKFIPPLRFFIELLIFLLLILALAGLYWKGDSRRAAVVVDNSESMGALLTVGGTSRLESSYSYVSSWLELLPGATTVDLYELSPALRKIRERGYRKGSVLNALEKIETVPNSDALPLHLEKLLSDDSYTDLLLVTDQRIVIPEEIKGKELEVYTVSSDSSASNVAISSMRTLRDPDSGAVGVEVKVRSFADEAQEVHLSLKKADPQLVFTPIRRTSFSLPERTEQLIQFKNMEPNTLYVSEVSSFEDLLPGDNAYSVYTGGEGTVLQVSSSWQLSRLNLPELPGVVIQSFQQKNIATETQLLLSHRLPFKREPFPSLTIVPKIASPNGTTSVIRNGGKIVRSNSSHPILDYIDLSRLDFGEVVPLSVPLWAEPLLEVQGGVVAYVGYENYIPRVVFGFELFPLQGRDSPARGILFINAIKWLKQATTGKQNTLHPGTSLSDFSEKTTIEFTSLQQNQIEKLSSSILPRERGVVRNSATQHLTPINFFAVEESNLSLKREQRLVLNEKGGKGVEQPDPLFEILLLLLMGLVVIDLLLLNLRPRYAMR